MPDIVGVLLAAGFSSRFGADKLLAEVDHQTLITHSASALSPCSRVIAVVRVSDTALQAELRALGVDCVFNTEPARGLGYSIACAIRATAHSSGWCLLPADMPRVLPATSARIVEALQYGADLVAPVYRGQRGHPVGFAARFYDDLGRLDGDAGARGIISAHPERLTALDTDDAGVLTDVDTVADLEKL